MGAEFMKNTKIAIIAGTPVDTKLGVNFLISKGVQAFGYPISSTPEEQSALQILSAETLTEQVRSRIKEIKNDGFETVVIYCNSMSAAVNMDKLSSQEDINIITPYNAYRQIAKKYNLIGLMTANNQSAAGIEKVIQTENPNCNVLGMSILPLVIEIEKDTSSDKIIEKFSLKKLLEFYINNKVEAILLGCTHFPCLKKELEKLTCIPIIDPAELMFKTIIEF
jgi:glutamate racemase